MTRPIFLIDGVSYNVSIPKGGLKRTAAVLDGDKAGRLQTGRMERDIIGTYYNYNMQIDTRGLDAAAYDRLYEVLTAPVDYHTISLPYGQSALTFEAYVSGAEDSLLAMQDEGNLWGDLTVTFTAMSPARR